MSDHSTHPHESLLTGDRLRQSVSILFAAIFAGLVILQIAHIQEEHSKIVLEGRDRAESLAHVLSEHLVQKVASFDSALSQIALHSERVGGPALTLAHLTGQPDLLVTDIVMAGSMNGRQFAERMRERWPDIKILYVSGYADGVLPELANGRVDGAHFLAKPFRRRDLAFRVREALDADIGAASFTV